ncbi:MAG: SDR family NAD(P)-dependent oxidoreductase [Rhodococcus sp.]|nr:SDR family NAD(P)-dependent oxidoreductase [Rhodococcus sp. (in: high G+C Gram-positive bacteria)]
MRGMRLLVTGAARGVGEQVARTAAARGARVALLGLEPDRLAAIAADIDGVWFPADVRDTNEMRDAIDLAADALGGIDLVVANAGIVDYGTVRQVDEAMFERVMDVNVTGTLRTLKYATPHLARSRGHVSVIASALSFLAIPTMSSYSASKAGVEMLALSYRQEVAHLGISVGLVHPSWLETDLVRGMDHDIPSFPAMRRHLPYPGNVTTDVETAAIAIVDGLASRRSRVYVPSAVGVVGWAKAAIASPASWLWTRRFAAIWVPRLEREITSRDIRRRTAAITGPTTDGVTD